MASPARLEPGERAPAFTLTAQRGEPLRLMELRGQRVLFGSAFLVDEKGRIEEAWYKISPTDTPEWLRAPAG